MQCVAHCWKKLLLWQNRFFSSLKSYIRTLNIFLWLNFNCDLILTVRYLGTYPVINLTNCKSHIVPQNTSAFIHAIGTWLSCTKVFITKKSEAAICLYGCVYPSDNQVFIFPFTLNKSGKMQWLSSGIWLSTIVPITPFLTLQRCHQSLIDKGMKFDYRALKALIRSSYRQNANYAYSELQTKTPFLTSRCTNRALEQISLLNLMEHGTAKSLQCRQCRQHNYVQIKKLKVNHTSHEIKSLFAA